MFLKRAEAPNAFQGTMSPFPCRSCQARRSFRHEEALVAASGLGASADNGAGFSAFKRHAVDHAWILRLASEGDEDSMEASSPDFQLKWSLSARLPLFEHRSNFNDELPKRHATSLAGSLARLPVGRRGPRSASANRPALQPPTPQLHWPSVERNLKLAAGAFDPPHNKSPVAVR
jgi:hypothetical protein